MLTRTALALAALAIVPARALKVASGSHCGPVCGNILEKTGPKDIVCKQDQYESTDAGRMFEECLSCMTSSVYTDDANDTDTQWMLCTFHCSSVLALLQ